MTLTTLSASDIERLAHKRAGARVGLHVRATVYLLVMLIHTALVRLAMPGAGVLQRLQTQRDP